MARTITLIDLVAVALVDCDVEAVPGLLIAQLCVLAGFVCVLPHTNAAEAHKKALVRGEGRGESRSCGEGCGGVALGATAMQLAAVWLYSGTQPSTKECCHGY